MNEFELKSTFDLAHYSESAKKEGFAVLHAGQGEKWTTVCSGPSKKMTKLPEGKVGQSVHIGYMAYPNPKLKNKIPDSKFYSYKNSITYKHKVGHPLATLKKEYKTSGKLEQSVTKSQYIKKIKEVKELLAAGEIYQLNYAIRFRKKFEGNPYSLYLKLIHENSTNFSVFLNCGDFQIVSNSPERLFKLEKNTLITQPIKGTMPKKGGKKNLEKLLSSEKERAELDMITDLERNDVGRVCKYGTLKLTKEREVMELPNLWHTYSEVQGKVPRGTKRADVIKAMFPGGSITGCPKIRAMEYIEKLEKLPRNIFTGSIFFLGQGVLDSSICIRTALIKDGYIEYWAGGGIVADSDPEAEYAECLLKAERFLGIL